jgi:two-component system, chemotaxis family, response regulator Rcp1
VTKGNNQKQTEVLVIEDNAADRFWLEYVLQNTGVRCTLSAVSDGEQALDFLLKRGEYVDAPTPDVIFLDAHLPKRDGLDVLHEIPNANRLPICVVTSSEGDRKRFREEFGIEDSNMMLKPMDHASLMRSACCRENLCLDHDQTLLGNDECDR